MFKSKSMASVATVKAAAHSAWRARPFQYTRALVRGLAPNFAAEAIRVAGPAVTISQEIAMKQHQAYVDALRSIIPDVQVLPPAENCPDSNFIEDMAVVIGNTALITHPGAESRRAETAGVADALSNLGLRIVQAPPSCTLDGGDVLFTGRELFVGLSERTDRGGYEAVRAAFPGVPVTPIPLPYSRFDGTIRDRSRRKTRSEVRAASDAAIVAKRLGRQPLRSAGHVHTADGSCCAESDLGSDEDGPLFHALHLKSLVSMAGPDIIAVADTEDGIAVAEAIQARQKGGDVRRRPLGFLVLPDAPAANMVFANGALLHRAAEEFPASIAELSALGPRVKRVGVSVWDCTRLSCGC